MLISAGGEDCSSNIALPFAAHCLFLTICVCRLYRKQDWIGVCVVPKQMEVRTGHDKLQRQRACCCACRGMAAPQPQVDGHRLVFLIDSCSG